MTDNIIKTRTEAEAVAELVVSPSIEYNDQLPPLAFLPDGPAKFELISMEQHLPAPLRKKGTVKLHELASFIDVVKKQGSLTSTNIYLDVDYSQSRIQATAVFNDHSDNANDAGWRDHRAMFFPRFSEEWNRWINTSGKQMAQVELAHFLERNIADIAGSEGSKLPSGSEVLTFVSKLEETRKVKYGSAVNLQNGMVQFEFVEDGDSNAKGKLDMFREFAIGVRPFQHGEAYQVKAFLRYRIDRNTGEIKFWFELQRADKVLEDACKEMIDAIKSSAGVPVLFGTPE